MRLAFSVAINVDAEILLIDEILAVGDQHFQEKCYAKLKELRDSGKTIVIVTHSLGVVKDLCHRAVWIYKGEFRLDGDPSYVIGEYLNQVALDHKKEVKKQIDEGKHEHKGAIYIDSPKDFSKINSSQKQLRIQGWEVSDDENAKLVIMVDDEELDSIRRHPRADVYDIYFEQYAGFIDKNTTGWICDYPLAKLSEGKHNITAKCVGKDRVLAEKQIEFSIVGEE